MLNASKRYLRIKENMKDRQALEENLQQVEVELVRLGHQFNYIIMEALINCSAHIRDQPKLGDVVNHGYIFCGYDFAEDYVSRIGRHMVTTWSKRAVRKKLVNPFINSYEVTDLGSYLETKRKVLDKCWGYQLGGAFLKRLPQFLMTKPTPVVLLSGLVDLVSDFSWQYSRRFERELQHQEERNHFDDKVQSYNVLMKEYNFLEARLEILDDK